MESPSWFTLQGVEHVVRPGWGGSFKAHRQVLGCNEKVWLKCGQIKQQDWSIHPDGQRHGDIHRSLLEEIIHLGFGDQLIHSTSTGHGLRADCEQGSGDIKMKTRRLLARGRLPVHGPGRNPDERSFTPRRGHRQPSGACYFLFVFYFIFLKMSKTFQRKENRIRELCKCSGIN